MKLPYIGKRKKAEFQQNLKENLERQKIETYSTILNNFSVDIIYYICMQQCVIQDFPFIATNWDIGHCSTFMFPELIDEYRNRFYAHVLPKALMIFTESSAGKSELLKYTNIGEHKLRIVPMFSGNCVNVITTCVDQKNILDEYELEKNRFFFYPAQFWAHKNHSILLEAFAELIKIYPNYKLVLTGSDKGNLEYIQLLASQLNIENKILFLGFLSINYINTFYLNAASLLMTTYLGPTNMPLIEAMELGCPVICSDIDGHHEILGEAAIYFNPMNENELYKAMIKMIKNMKTYRELIIKRNKKSIFRIDYSIKKINEYFKEAAVIRNTWK
jgi:glycosyltransferase involved in cell wall biosynthesis